MNYLKKAIDSPWKAINELRMICVKPTAWFYLNILFGIKIGNGFKFYGLPRIFKYWKSSIIIGCRFENRNC